MPSLEFGKYIKEKGSNSEWQQSILFENARMIPNTFYVT